MDELDVGALSRRYGPMVLRRCRQLLRNEDEALDACQDVFVRLIEGRRRLNAQYPSSLLYRMATNVCLNRIRDRGLIDVADGDPRAFRRELERRRPADALPGAGDDRNLVRQPHGVPSPRTFASGCRRAGKPS